MARVLTVVAILLQAALALGAVSGSNGSSDPRPGISCDPQYMSTQACQNFARMCMNELNDQIKLELTAAYTYDAMATYYARDDVAYRGFAKYFSGMAAEEHEHAQKLQDYVVKRGGRVYYKTISSPQTEWQTPLHGLKQALAFEKLINNQLLDLHWIAQEKNDPHLQNYLEDEFLPEQVASAKKLSDWSSIMTRLETDAIGWTIIDEELYSGKRS